MSGLPPKRVYLDTNVLLTKLFDEKERIERVKFWEEYAEKRKGVRLIVSTFTLMELLHVIRSRLIEKCDPNTDLEEARNYMIEESEKLFKSIMEHMIRMPKIFAISYSVNITIDSNVLELQLKCIGDVRRGKCACQKSTILKYGGVSHADMVHLVMAKQLDCDTFLTFDRGFEHLKKAIYTPRIIIL